MGRGVGVGDINNSRLTFGGDENTRSRSWSTTAKKSHSSPFDTFTHRTDPDLLTYHILRSIYIIHLSPLYVAQGLFSTYPTHRKYVGLSGAHPATWSVGHSSDHVGPGFLCPEIHRSSTDNLWGSNVPEVGMIPLGLQFCSPAPVVFSVDERAPPPSSPRSTACRLQQQL